MAAGPKPRGAARMALAVLEKLLLLWRSPVRVRMSALDRDDASCEAFCRAVVFGDTCFGPPPCLGGMALVDFESTETREHLTPLSYYGRSRFW